MWMMNTYLAFSPFIYTRVAQERTEQSDTVDFQDFASNQQLLSSLCWIEHLEAR